VGDLVIGELDRAWIETLGLAAAVCGRGERENRDSEHSSESDGQKESPTVLQS
jgi:hypothetical protein